MVRRPGRERRDGRRGPGRGDLALLRLVLDWDGTCTERDSLVDAVYELGDPSVYEQRFASYGEALAAEVATLTCTAEEAGAWAVEHVRLRPGFHELVERCSPLIVSSGLEQLILPVLAREGVEVELLANAAEPRADGWRIRFRDPEPCPVCGDICKRAALPNGAAVYAGDGVSDRCAALAAQRVFARAELAAYLEERGVPFEPFDDLNDVLRAVDVRRTPR